MTPPKGSEWVPIILLLALVFVGLVWLAMGSKLP
jgi:hypothetical protein